MKPSSPMIALARQTNRAVIVWQYVYETRLAPWLALWFWPIFWPLYKLLRYYDVRLVIDMGEGTGQVLPELDNFFRRMSEGSLELGKKYVWIRRRDDFSKACVPFYKHFFTRAYMSTLLYDVLLPVQLRGWDVTHSAGLSGLRWQLPQSGRYTPAPPWQTYLDRLPKENTIRQWRTYYARRAQHPNWYPLRDTAGGQLQPGQELIEFLGGSADNIALIHIKENVMNATARVTDPATYVPTLKMLKERGYQLVFVGREAMPDAFRQFNMRNYAQSPIASFRHDLQLFNLATIAITGGSGIAWIADTLGTPTVYLNSWHLFMPPFQKHCVYAPTLLQDASGRYLSFTEQWAHFIAANTKNGNVFTSRELVPCNASSDDALAATRELLALLKRYQERSSLQEQYATHGTDGWLTYAQSRISQKFIEKHRTLLNQADTIPHTVTASHKTPYPAQA